MTNEQRAEMLLKKYGFSFHSIPKDEIRSLLETEIAHHQEGSSEYIRLLCGYLYCIGDSSDVSLLEMAKYQINMDVGCMIDQEWLDSLKNGGAEEESVRGREDIVKRFISYYQNYFTAENVIEESLVNSLYFRILQLAQSVVDVYRGALTPEDLERFEQVMAVFQKCQEPQGHDYGNLYDVIDGEDGIWVLGEDTTLPKPIQECWRLETCLLSCYIRLKFDDHNEVIPQDLEMQAEKIPDFIAFMETHFHSQQDFYRCFDFFSHTVCY